MTFLTVLADIVGRPLLFRAFRRAFIIDSKKALQSMMRIGGVLETPSGLLGFARGFYQVLGLFVLFLGRHMHGTERALGAFRLLNSATAERQPD